MPDEQAKSATLERIARANLGSPTVVGTELVRIPYLAREGRVLTIVRNDGARNESVDEGLFAIALDADAYLPVELLDPRVLQPAAESENAVPELSLDTFDQLVREKLEAKIRESSTPTDIDLHPTWGPRVHLVHLPFVAVTYTLPKPGWFRSFEKHPSGRYRALVSLHDGVVKHLDLPKIRTRTELGLLAGVGALGIVLCVLAVLLLAVVLAVYFS